MTKRLTKHYEEQMRMLGHQYDWARTVTTSDPDYYKWTQWIFIQMFKAGLAYRAKATVNFCPKCKTVLSDEQVIDGKCERCETVVEKKELEQWFFKITTYADRLLKNLDNLDWTQKIKTAQRNWIGKKEGRKIKFGEIEIFTTRPETILGATFVILSPSHHLAGRVKTVINPATKRKIPVFVDEYVLDGIGTGAIMGVPAYDQRDCQFAKEHKLPIIKAPLTNEVFGEKVITYHLRDWLISRQRYWGPPIPMIFCQKCQWQPVPEEDLPVLLPDIKDYQPEGNGKGPLTNHPEFFKTKCPTCQGEAVRETDVSDTFLDSAWYELRYPSVGFNDTPFDQKITKKWLPVDMYTGGAEHAVLHLMYFRFVTMALHDLGFLDFEEPTKQFFAHGMIIKDGAKMSKSRGNVINPDEYIKKYGADALRLYFMFMGPVSDGGDFKDAAMIGMKRWTDRLWRVFNDQIDRLDDQMRPDPAIEFVLLRLVKKTTQDIETRHYNTAISKMMELINLITSQEKKMTAKQIETVLILLAPFAPHMAEELWALLGKKDSIHQQKWPEIGVETDLVDKKITIAVSVNGKTRATLEFSTVDGKVLNQKEIELAAQSNDQVAKYLSGKQIKRVIYIKDRIINFVV